MWYSDLPFLTSNQIHQAWAFANNINLLSAGANKPKDGNSGSGIFIGKHEISQMFISPYPTQQLLTATIPKDPRKFTALFTSAKQTKDKIKRHSPVEMQNLHLTEYWAESDSKTENISNDGQPQTICVNDNKDICCTFDIKMKTKEILTNKIAYNYKLIANYSTKMYSIDRECGEIYCAVIACKTNNPKSCGRRFKINNNLVNAVEFEKIEIKAKIKYNNSSDLLIMPTTLDTSILPFDLNEYKFEIITNNPKTR